MEIKVEKSSKGGSDYEGPRPGDLIAGKYEIQQVIGAGGMGVVLAARHTSLHQRVAIKFLRGKAHPELVMRFMREARAAAAIRSEHVVKVTDVDRLPTGEPYMVMEFLAGQNLSKVIRRYQPRPVPLAEAADYMIQACEAIGEAHGLGIVHRDLKPGNLFVTQRQDGSPLLKVLDFGISKFTEDGVEEQTLTATNMILGSPQYASPEQLRNVKGADSRTDIWALGVILYYMLTARRPFEGETVSALCLQIATEEPPPVRMSHPEIPEEVERMVMRCLTKDRDKRVQSVQEIVRTLAPYAPHTRVASSPDLSAPSGAMSSGAMPSGPHGAVPMGGMPLLPPASGAGLREGDSTPGSFPSSTSGPLPLPAASVGATAAGRVIQIGPSGEVVTSATRGAWATNASSRTSTIAFRVGAIVGVAACIVVGAIYLRPDEEQKLADIPTMEVAGHTTAKPRATARPRGNVSTDIVVGTNRVEEVDAGEKDKKRPGADVPVVGVGQTSDALGWALAKQTLLLTSAPGGGSVVGRVPAGEACMVVKFQGEWRLVAYIKKGLTIQGWANENDLKLP